LEIIAIERGEQVNALWVVAAALAVYLIADRYPSLSIANRVMKLNPNRATPAVRHNDEPDSVPTNLYVSFGRRGGLPWRDPASADIFLDCVEENIEDRLRTGDRTRALESARLLWAKSPAW
jgi:hypothetical protein